MVLVGGDLLERAAGDDGGGFGVGDGGGFGSALKVVVLLNKEPVGLGLFGARGHANERPLAMHLGAVHGEFELAVAQAGVYVFMPGLRSPGALVPEHDRASAVLALGDDALEAAVLDGMVFDLDSEATVLDYVAGPLGAGPGLEYAVPAEAEVVVEMGSGVLLDTEGELVEGGGGGFSGGLGGDVEVAHGAIARELCVYGVAGRLAGRGLFRRFLGRDARGTLPGRHEVRTYSAWKEQTSLATSSRLPIWMEA